MLAPRKKAYWFSIATYFLLIFLLLAATNLPCRATVYIAKYGNNISIDPVYLNNTAQAGLDSMLRAHPQMSGKITADIQAFRVFKTQTIDFYLLLSLCLMFGVIRYIDKEYFLNLWQMFINPSLSTNQIKEHIKNLVLQNFLMNLLFFIVFGSYIYYVMSYFSHNKAYSLPDSLLILFLIVGIAGIYFGKYVVVRLGGWAFGAKTTTEEYLFNVFLVNKIMAVVLIPFIIIMAFAGKAIMQQMMLISFLVVIGMFLNRYIRSWKIFDAIFHNSKFHFFLYLCTSEILPMAVLLKILITTLI